MKTPPSHGKAGRPGSRAAEANRRTGFTTGAVLAMIRRELQGRRARTGAGSEAPPDLAAQIAALRDRLEPGRGPEAFLHEVKALLADHLVTLEQQVVAAATTAVSGPAEMIRRDVASLKEIQASVDRRTQDTFEAVYGTIERIADRLAAIEDEMRDRDGAAPAGREPPPSATPAPDPARRTTEVGAAPAGPGPAQSSPPHPDTATADSAVSRTAAREPAAREPAAREPVRREVAELEAVRSKIAELEAAAAARGSGATASRAPAGPRLAGHRSLREDGASRRTARPDPAADDDDSIPGLPAPGAGSSQRAVLRRPAALPRGGFAGKVGLARGGKRLARPWRVRPSPTSVAIAVGGALLVVLVGAAAIAIDRYLVRPAATVGDAGDSGEMTDSGALGAVATTVGQGGADPPREETPATRGQDPGGGEAAAPVAADGGGADGGSVPTTRNALLLPTPPGGEAEAADPALALPAAIGGKALVAAAQAGDAGACYEIGVRLAQGRAGVAQDGARAAVFLERAARAGVVPAQFSLGVLYEKGQGVGKDPGEAARLYAAAAARGHARAMHGLAALLDRGLDGPPDHARALEWFRKAAAYGVADSQYALGVAAARRGGGRDAIEAYKWLALAARGGHRDAARERDEVAAGLSAADLTAARADVEAFVAIPQPDQATATRAPPAGWDPPAVAATTKSRPAPRAERLPQR